MVFSLVGILLATALPNLLNYHLDFSIIAIFVAMIVPMCKGKPVMAGILMTCVSGFVLKFFSYRRCHSNFWFIGDVYCGNSRK